MSPAAATTQPKFHYAWIVAGVTFVTLLAAAGARATPGVIILPLMIFHQLQLFVCAVIAARYRRQLDEEA